MTLVMALGVLSLVSFAKDYTAFNIVFEEKEGEKVNETEVKIFASVDGGELVDRTEEFTVEDKVWFKYISAPADGKTADDYDYVDEELKIYGMLCSDEDVFEHDNFKYFLRIARLYAQEEDSFTRDVKINGVDIDELNGSCYNTGSEFYIKTITNGMGGISGEGDVTDVTGEPQGEPGDSEQTKEKCKVCGICPVQPLGICLFIWIAIILVVVIVVVIIAAKSRKKDKEDK